MAKILMQGNLGFLAITQDVEHKIALMASCDAG
jgi:hypothetical protein